MGLGRCDTPSGELESATARGAISSSLSDTPTRSLWIVYFVHMHAEFHISDWKKITAKVAKKAEPLDDVGSVSSLEPLCRKTQTFVLKSSIGDVIEMRTKRNESRFEPSATSPPSRCRSVTHTRLCLEMSRRLEYACNLRRLFCSRGLKLQSGVQCNVCTAA